MKPPHGAVRARIASVVLCSVASQVLMTGCGTGGSRVSSSASDQALHVEGEVVSGGRTGAERPPQGTFSAAGGPAAKGSTDIATSKGRLDPAPPLFRGDFEEEVLLTGELKAVRARTIVAPETSIFQMRIQYLPEEGSEVKQGAPLVDFDNTALADRVQDLETRILDAETQIAAKRSELATSLMDLEIERTQKKYEADKAVVRAAIDPEVVSRKEFAERQFEKRKALMELAEVQERIDRTHSKGQAELDVLIIDKEKLERDLLSTRKDLEILSVKAPQDGLVVYEYREGSQLKWREGDNVWPGQPVVSLPDLSEMEVLFSVSEVDAPRLRAGMPLRITIDSVPQRELSGRIVEIPSMAVTRDSDSRVRIFRIRSTLSETIHGVMKPGMSVLGRVSLGRRAGALLVAREAVTQDGTRYRITKRNGGSAAAEQQEIHPVGRNATHYLLEPGPDTDSADRSAAEVSAPAPRPSETPAAPTEPAHAKPSGSPKTTTPAASATHASPANGPAR